MRPAELADALVADGYVIVEDLLSRDQVARARRELTPLLDAAPFGANSFVGRRTKRVFGLPAKVRALDELLVHPLVLGALDQVLGDYLLSTTVAVEIHPGESAQTVHTDAGAWPVPFEVGPILVNAIWALDDFTEGNGGTRLVPGSHLVDGPPPDGAAAVTVTMPAGSALVYAGTLWHGGGENRTGDRRLGVIVGYLRAWLRQQESFMTTCPPDVARSLSPRLQELLGYTLYPPFVGHVDGRHPGELLR